MNDTSSLQRLAIFGGTPVSAEVLHVGRPNVLDRARLFELIDQSLERDWLTNDGPLVRELEARFAEFAEVDHAIAVANATLGLQMVAVALDLHGDVIMPAFTFIGTAHALAWIGLQPVFADVLADGHTIDPQAVERCLTPSTAAILGVHLWGGACKVDELQAVADRAGLPLFFDAAHAVGSTYAGRPVGRFGRAEVFSLHATKAINALEAGIITTSDQSLAERLRLLRNYAFADEDVVVGLGINAKLNEFAAAMGISNLAHFDTVREHNRAVHEAFAEGLRGAPDARLLDIAPGELNSYHYAVVELDPQLRLSRDELQRLLVAENVRARRYFRPGCHRCPPYSESGPVPDLPVTDRLAESLIQLPTGLQIDAPTARAIGELIAYCCANAELIRTRLNETRPPA